MHQPCVLISGELCRVTWQSFSLLLMFSPVSSPSVALMVEAEGLIRPSIKVVYAVETIVLMSSIKDPLIAWCCQWKNSVCQNPVQYTKNNEYLLRAKPAVLTVHAVDFRDIPSSIPTTTDSWDMPLYEAFPALVPHQWINLIPLTFLTKSLCILHQRGLATGHWETEVTVRMRNFTVTDNSIRVVFSNLQMHAFSKTRWFVLSSYLCPSCRYRWGGSCKEHHSTGHPHARSSLHNPHQRRRSCQAGLASSFHIAKIRVRWVRHVDGYFVLSRTYIS